MAVSYWLADKAALLLDGCEELLSSQNNIFATWPLRLVRQNGESDTSFLRTAVGRSDSPVQHDASRKGGFGIDWRKTLITVRKAGLSAWSITAPWQLRPAVEPTLACAACSLSIELVMAWCMRSPGLCQLHAACAGLPAGTFLFIGGNRSGKSCLMARLMADGCMCYGDDMLAIADVSTVYSFGIPPRLRFPLPNSGPLAFFTAANAFLGDDRYVYLRPRLRALASFGQRAAMAGCVFLERKDGAKPALRRLTACAELLAPHCVLSAGAAHIALRALHKLAETLPFYVFTYDSLDEAAEYLRHNFIGPMDAHCPDPLLLPKRETAAQNQLDSTELASLPPDANYVCAANVELTRTEQGALLALHGGDAIFQLNDVGLLLWHMLGQPMCINDASQLLAEAFPQINADAIRRDVTQLFANLLREEFIKEI